MKQLPVHTFKIYTLNSPYKQDTYETPQYSDIKKHISLVRAAPRGVDRDRSIKSNDLDTRHSRFSQAQ